MNKEDIEIQHIHGHYCQSEELIQSKNCLLASAKKVNDNFYQDKIWNLINVNQKINFYILGINTSNDIELFNYLLNFASKNKNFNLYYSFFEQNDIDYFINININFNDSNNNIFLFDAKKFWKELENDQTLNLFKNVQSKPIKEIIRVTLAEINKQITEKEKEMHFIERDIKNSSESITFLKAQLEEKTMSIKNELMSSHQETEVTKNIEIKLDNVRKEAENKINEFQERLNINRRKRESVEVEKLELLERRDKFLEAAIKKQKETNEEIIKMMKKPTSS